MNWCVFCGGVKLSNIGETGESGEVRKVQSFDEFMELSEDERAERKAFSVTENGSVIKARLLIDGIWYVSSRTLRESYYLREGCDSNNGVGGYTKAEVFLDEDVHPYWLAYYGDGDVRHEFREYHKLFITNTDLGSGMARLNQKLLSEVKRVLKESEDHANVWKRWKDKVEEKKREKESELREAFFEEISSSSTPSRDFDREVLFQNWFRDNFLGEEYQEKIEKTSKLKERAETRWIEEYKGKLEYKGFKSIA